MNDQVFYFGEKWDVPLLDNGIEVPPPLDSHCIHCSERIVNGDQGFLGFTSAMGNSQGLSVTRAEHRECHLMMVIGGIAHLEGRCYCYAGKDSEPFPGTGREEARAVLAWVTQHGAARLT